jgi:hypothetical protein
LVITPGDQGFSATVGMQSTPVTFGVANAGDIAVGPLKVEITGPDAASFIIVATDCLELQPLGACTVAVAFAPTVVSCRMTARLVISGPAPDFVSVSAGLMSTVCGPAGLKILPTRSDLGSVSVGAVGEAVTFTLSLGECQQLPVAGPFTVATSSPEFVITHETCSTTTTLVLGVGCTITVSFRPSSVGLKTATLTAQEASGVTTGKTLTGTGVPADAGIVDAPPVNVDASLVDGAAAEAGGGG